MKKIYTLITLLSFAIISNAQIPNPGFENWTDGNPTSWNSLNGTIAGSVMQKTTSPYAGSSSVNIVSKNLVIPPIFQGLDSIRTPFTGVLTCGTIGMGDPTGGAAFTDTPEKIVGWFKYHTDSITDDAIVKVRLQNGGSDIATGEFTSSGNVDVWTKFEVNLSYSNYIQPDKIIITFYSSKTNATKPGSTFTIDELSAEGNALGLENIEENNVKVFPTNADNYLFVNLENNNTDTKIQIVNLNGQIVYNSQIQNGELNKTINVSNLSSGMYFVKVYNSEYQSVNKINIQ